MLFVIAAGVADVFAMAKGLGIAPADALAVFSKFQPGGVIKSRGEKMARGDFSASFELTMARKDIRLMIEAAGDAADGGAAGDREGDGPRDREWARPRGPRRDRGGGRRRRNRGRAWAGGAGRAGQVARRRQPSAPI